MSETAPVLRTINPRTPLELLKRGSVFPPTMAVERAIFVSVPVALDTQVERLRVIRIGRIEQVERARRLRQAGEYLPDHVQTRWVDAVDVVV